MTDLKRFTKEEVARHGSADSLYVMIDGGVYDLTKFARFHPGGRRPLLELAGKDATEAFFSLHSRELLEKYKPRLLVGRLAGAEGDAAGGEDRSLEALTARSLDRARAFGDAEPWSEPLWYRKGFCSPYYTDSHRRFRARVRHFVETELKPGATQWDAAGKYPAALHEKAYRAGVLGARWPAEYGGTPPEGGFDAFHLLVLYDELARCASGGILWALFFSLDVALPPVLHHGTPELRGRVARDVVTGRKIMALAITEPYAGSDVARIRTTAVRDGDHYVVNGEKKFITSGVRADFFTVAVRTGQAGMGGVSLLLVEKDTPGFSARKMPTQGMSVSGTAYLVFEDCRVPAANLIGREGRGFKYVMHNFNLERFGFAAVCTRYARTMLQDAVRYARVRKTFGRPLTQHQVIRHKLAEMARQVEHAHSQLETVAYQVAQGVPESALGGPMALLKVNATKTMEFCAREASQVFGGSSWIRSGIGARVERLYREVRFNAIAGGSEEIMLDLATRQARL